MSNQLNIFEIFLYYQNLFELYLPQQITLDEKLHIFQAADLVVDPLLILDEVVSQVDEVEVEDDEVVGSFTLIYKIKK
jgi:hypothetical protein